MVSLRPAGPDDAADVAALLVELGYPDNEVDVVERRLAMWARDPAGVVLLAQLDGRVVGTVAVTAIPYLEREGCWGRIVALVVSAECRGQGVGRQLVDAAEAAARDLGCVAMEVSSSRARTGSHPFYRTLGYQDWADHSTRYLKDLRPARTAAG
jgi:predicted N-acetyltransferase YhbS